MGVALGLYYSTVRNVAGSHVGQRSEVSMFVLGSEFGKSRLLD